MSGGDGVAQRERLGRIGVDMVVFRWRRFCRGRRGAGASLPGCRVGSSGQSWDSTRHLRRRRESRRHAGSSTVDDMFCIHLFVVAVIATYLLSLSDSK